MQTMLTLKPYCGWVFLACAWASQLLQLQYGVEPERTAVVGDRLDTDIQMGWNAGAALNIMTLSGVGLENILFTLTFPDKYM